MCTDSCIVAGMVDIDELQGQLRAATARGELREVSRRSGVPYGTVRRIRDMKPPQSARLNTLERIAQGTRSDARPIAVQGQE